MPGVLEEDRVGDELRMQVRIDLVRAVQDAGRSRVPRELQRSRKTRARERESCRCSRENCKVL